MLHLTIDGDSQRKGRKLTAKVARFILLTVIISMKDETLLK